MYESSTSSEKTSRPGCVAVAVAILGDKWTPHIIRALAAERLRFCQLQNAVGGVNPRTLSARLTRLEEEGILDKAILSEIPPHTEYSLTPKGKDLLPILEQMAAWGEKHGSAVSA
jgi:DNA-binding HxlR family transcriptional regulator